jgi:hypothetical protein
MDAASHGAGEKEGYGWYEMGLKVTVGPPVITINHGHTFLVSELDGSITGASDQGFYSRDTRYLSRYQLYIDGQRWTLLNSGAIAYYASHTYLMNPKVNTGHGTILAETVGLVLGRDPPRMIHGHPNGRPCLFRFR